MTSKVHAVLSLFNGGSLLDYCSAGNNLFKWRKECEKLNVSDMIYVTVQCALVSNSCFSKIIMSNVSL